MLAFHPHPDYEQQLKTSKLNLLGYMISDIRSSIKAMTI